MTPESTIGLDTAYNIIMTLLQQSGWYMYFDNTGKAIIGVANRSGSPTETFDGEDIIEASRNLNDEIMRNRVVIWGSHSSQFGTWITAEASTRTAWDIDNNDIRTTVISNPHIYTYYNAGSLASTLLNELAIIIDEKEILVHGARDIEIGDTVRIENITYNGNGIVTSITSEMSDKGLTTRLFLDEKCPRLFAFYDDYIGNYVYIGTQISGVWRKPLDSLEWEDYSTGLDDLNIIDLNIKNGNMVCVGNDGDAFIRNTGGGLWSKINPGSMTFSGVSYPESGIRAVACSINSIGLTKIGYTHRTEELSWLYTNGVIENVVTEANDNITIIDIDSQVDDIVVSQGSDFVYYEWDGSTPFPALANTYAFQQDVAMSTPNGYSYTYCPPPTDGIKTEYGVTFSREQLQSGQIRILQNEEGITEWWSVGDTYVVRRVPIDDAISDTIQYLYEITASDSGIYQNNIYVDFGSRVVYMLRHWHGGTLSGTINVFNIDTEALISSYSLSVGGDNSWVDTPIDLNAVNCYQYGAYVYQPAFGEWLDISGYWMYRVGFYKINVLSGEASIIIVDEVESTYASSSDYYGLSIIGGRCETDGSYNLFYTKTEPYQDHGGGGTVYIDRYAILKGESAYNSVTFFHGQYSGSTIEGAAYNSNRWSRPASYGTAMGYICRRTMSNISKVYFPTLGGSGSIQVLDYDDLDADAIEFLNYNLGPDDIMSSSCYIYHGGLDDSGDHCAIANWANFPVGGTGSWVEIKVFDIKTLELVKSNTVDFTGLCDFSDDVYGFLTVPKRDSYNGWLLGIVLTSSDTHAHIVGLNYGSLELEMFNDKSFTVSEYISTVEVDVLGNTVCTHDIFGSSWYWKDYTIYYTYYQTANKVLKHIGENLFTNIYNGPVDKVEMSKPSPTVVYHEAEAEGLLSQISSHIAVSHTNISGSFTSPETQLPAKDLRVFNLGEYGQDATYSGSSRYIGIATGQSFSKLNATLSGSWTTVEEFLPTENTLKIETSNFNERPYMFTVVSSGVGNSKFYQANADSDVWVNNSVSLPSGVINIIRIDDRI